MDSALSPANAPCHVLRVTLGCPPPPPRFFRRCPTQLHPLFSTPTAYFPVSN
jgi:hypothetical protein